MICVSFSHLFLFEAVNLFLWLSNKKWYHRLWAEALDKTSPDPVSRPVMPVLPLRISLELNQPIRDFTSWARAWRFQKPSENIIIMNSCRWQKLLWFIERKSDFGFFIISYSYAVIILQQNKFFEGLKSTKCPIGSWSCHTNVMQLTWKLREKCWSTALTRADIP